MIKTLSPYSMTRPARFAGKNQPSVPPAMPLADPGLKAPLPKGGYYPAMIRFGQDKPLALPIPESAIDPAFAEVLKQILKSRQSATPPVVTMRSLLEGLLTNPAFKEEGEALFEDGLKVAPQTFLKRLQDKPELGAADENNPPAGDLGGLVAEHLKDTFGQMRLAAQQRKDPAPVIVTLGDFIVRLLMSENESLKPLAEAIKEISYLRIKHGRILPSILDEFSKDMTLQSESGKLSPVIGRDQETLNVITVLTKNKKRNPVLVGEAGTGKTAIVEKLAQWLAAGKVPKGLIRADGRGMFLKQLQWSKIEALGSEKAKAALEEIIDEAKKRRNEVLIFFDEVHRINPEMDTQGYANMWKEPLARGEVALIGATTPDEYRKRIKKDQALDRRFHEVPVAETTLPETFTILRGLRSYMENRHHVVVRDDALETATYKTKRYMASKFMPDAAVDVIDTACAMVKNQVDGPTYQRLLKEGQVYLESVKVSQGLQKRIEEFKSDLVRLDGNNAQGKTALIKLIQTPPGLRGSQLKLAPALVDRIIDRQVNGLKSQAAASASPDADWEAKLEKEYKEPLGKLIKSVRHSTIKHKNLADSEKELTALEEKIKTLKQQLIDEQILPVVGIDDVLKVISDQSSVPINKLSEDEEEKLLSMKGEIRKRVIAQGPAVEAVVSAIQKNKLGMTKGNRPIGSFIFLGPTGVGKTELAKAVAEYLFGDEGAMIRVDMSEMMEEHSVSKLIGSPPGYVGYDDGGQLTEKVRKRPYSVILFDEIEKAHPRVFDLMLQILDDGRLTDSQGRTADFKNTIVMMTSNKGTVEIMKQFNQIGGDLDPDSERFKHLNRNLQKFAKKAISEDVRFRPEFLNRVDEIVTFHPLMQNHIKEIIPIQIRQLNADLLNTDAKIQVKLDPSAIDYLAEKGTDVMMGARPLKRLIDTIKSAIAVELLNGKIYPGDLLTLTADTLKNWEKSAESRKQG